MSSEEISEMMGFVPQESKKAPTKLGRLGDLDEPRSINWIDKGCMQDVRDQGKCGSCYSFAATAAIEGAHCAFTTELLDLSEKDCMDCSFRYNNKGCNGGHMTNCYDYFMYSHKMCHEDAYPYKAKYQTCKENSCSFGHYFADPVTSYNTVDPKDIYDFMDALDKQPLSLAIQAKSDMVLSYKDGVLLDSKSEKCGKKLDHAVVAVGYYYTGDRLSPDNYVLIRNSWGEDWGKDGYMKLGFGDLDVGGTCGFMLDVSYPVTP